MNRTPFARLHTIRTGDVILTSDVSLTGYIVHLFLSATWNHVGIAIRMKDGKVTMDQDGDLHVFEISPRTRECPVWGGMIKGCGFTKLSSLMHYYDRVAVRRLGKKYLTQDFCDRATEFILRERGRSDFPETLTPIADIWLGVRKSDDREKTELFCSEMVAYFYEYTLESFSIEMLVGRKIPKNICRPDDLAGVSLILDEMELVSQRNQSTLMMTTRPLFFILAVSLVVYALLPM